MDHGFVQRTRPDRDFFEAPQTRLEAGELGVENRRRDGVVVERRAPRILDGDHFMRERDRDLRQGAGLRRGCGGVYQLSSELFAAEPIRDYVDQPGAEAHFTEAVLSRGKTIPPQKEVVLIRQHDHG